jgi:hypothetical protein
VCLSQRESCLGKQRWVEISPFAESQRSFERCPCFGPPAERQQRAAEAGQRICQEGMVGRDLGFPMRKGILE